MGMLVVVQNYFLVLELSNQFDFYFPLSQIIEAAQRKTQIKLVKLVKPELNVQTDSIRTKVFV